jgi:hypothetical protein
MRLGLLCTSAPVDLGCVAFAPPPPPAHALSIGSKMLNASSRLVLKAAGRIAAAPLQRSFAQPQLARMYHAPLREMNFLVNDVCVRELLAWN